MDYPSILEILRLELEKRIQRNPKYSQNAFARDLGVTSARLSEILAGKKGLSRDAAKQIGQNLEMDQTNLVMFCDLADSHFARGALQRELALQRLGRRRTPNPALRGLWQLSHRRSGGGSQPYDWNPKKFTQLFEIQKDQYSFTMSFGTKGLSKISGPIGLEQKTLFTATADKWVVGQRSKTASVPWLAAKHGLTWISERQFALSTSHHDLPEGVCPPGESLETIWTRIKD